MPLNGTGEYSNALRVMGGVSSEQGNALISVEITPLCLLTSEISRETSERTNSEDGLGLGGLSA